MAAQFRQRSAGERRHSTEALIAARSSDVERWSEPENLKSNWADRAKVAARLVPPGSRVLDLGCGGMDLERFLDASVTYLPSDIVARDERTLVCDLNAGELPQARADVITLLGVLEYIHDVPALFSALRGTGARVIASYNAADAGEPGRDRRAQGWFNDFASAELCALAADAGLAVVGLVPLGPQLVYELRPA